MPPRRRLALPSTRIGGPLRKKKPTGSTTLTSKAGIVSGGGPSSDAAVGRCSPYMFYHGDEIVFEDNLPKEVKPKKGAKKPSAADEDGTTSPPVKSPPPEETTTQASPSNPRHLYAMASPTLIHPTATLSELDDYDDDFTGGAVVSMIKELKRRREAVAKRKFTAELEAPCPENLVQFQQRLAAEVRHNDGTTPLVEVPHFIGLMKDVYGVEADVVLDLFCKELDPNNSGSLPFTRIMEILGNIVAGEHRETTMAACFRVFDVDEQRTLTLRRMKRMRASKPKERYGTSGASFVAIKAVLDLWTHDPALATTLTFNDFVPYWDTQEALVKGFIEEILRTVLVVEFKYDRKKLLAMPDPPTLYDCHSGLVSGYDKRLISSLPD